jgi:hypothetical protein
MAKAPKAETPENEDSTANANDGLVRMVMDGEELFVHPDAVDAHKRVGWVRSE